MNFKLLSKEDLKELLANVKVLRESYHTCVIEGLIETALMTNKQMEFWSYTLNSSPSINVLVARKDYKEQHFYRYFIFGQDNGILTKLLNIVTKKNNHEMICFELVSEKHCQLLIDFFRGSEFQLRIKIPLNTYVADSYSIKSFPNKFGFKVDELKVEDTEYVNSEWKYKDEEYSYGFIYDGIKHKPSVSVRNDENVLISYEHIQMDNSMMHLKTNEMYQRKGLASFVITTLAKKILESQDYAVTYIQPGNVASEQLHEKCGFVSRPSSMVFTCYFQK